MPPAVLTERSAWAGHRPDPRSEPGRRLAWLDALRGIAAMAVVVAHLSYLVFIELRPKVFVPWFDIGKYGVFVFFLVSGYIVPASLERHGCVRRFWISRAFRLYPLFMLATGAMAVLAASGLVPLDRPIRQDPVTATAAHLTFLQDLLGVENILNVLWTLSYEMVFYLLVTVLFVFGLHRRTAEISVGFAVASVAVAPLLPSVVLLSRDLTSTRLVVAATVVLLVVGLAFVVSGSAVHRRVGALVLAALALALLAFNQRAGTWEGLVILATMFTGTTIHQVQHGHVTRRKGVIAIGTVALLALCSGVVNFRLWAATTGAELRNADRTWVIVISLAGVTFAAAWLLRNRRFSRALVWLGLVSYSLYLMHAVVLAVFFRWLGDYRFGFSFATQVCLATGIMAVLLVLVAMTYRYVERPAQRLGRRAAERWR